MMIPERMTSAAGAVGMGRATLEVAARYSTRRKAFGMEIKIFRVSTSRLPTVFPVLMQHAVDLCRREVG